MKTLLKTLVLVSLSTLLAHAKPEPLFDGKSLDGWRVDGAAYWTVKDGVLVGKSDEAKKGSILWTQKEFGDFVYETEFRFNGVTDSGVFLRHLDDQIQIGISGSLKRDMTGSPYIGTKRKYPVEAEGVAALLKEGVWNKFKITAKGSLYTVELNGKKVLEYTSDTAIAKGPIGLQVHANLLMTIEYRNMTVTPL